MLDHITGVAQRFDEWLHQHLGRPYTAVLGIGLVLMLVFDLLLLRFAWPTARILR